MIGFRSVLSIVIVSAILLFPITALAQQTKPSASASDIETSLHNAGLPPDVKIITVNINGSSLFGETLVILGSGVDSTENQMFKGLGGYNIDPGHILNDKARMFSNKGIESYDLLVVGGPDHNTYTKELLDRGILKYTSTDLKAPGFLVEIETLPGGHTVMIMASTASYPYIEKAAINGSTSKPVPGQASARPDTGDNAVSANNDTEQNNVVNDMMNGIREQDLPDELGPTLQLKPGFNYYYQVYAILEKQARSTGYITDKEDDFLREHQDVLMEIFVNALNISEDRLSQPMGGSKEVISDQPGIIGDMGANLG